MSKVKSRNYINDSEYVASSIKTHKLTLKFTDKMEERMFRRLYSLSQRKIARIVIAMLLLVGIVNYPIDIWIYYYDDDIWKKRAIIRSILHIPVNILWLFRAMIVEKKENSNDYAKREWDNKNGKIKLKLCGKVMYIKKYYFMFICYTEYYKIATICSFLIGISTLCQTIISKQPVSALYMMYFFIVFLFIGIPFAFALIISWIIFIGFCGAMFVVKFEDIYYTNGYLTDSDLSLVFIYLSLTLILLTLSSYSLERSERIEWIHDKELGYEQNMLATLLNNLLPQHVTEKLRNGDNMVAESYNECSILFSDLVSFTKYSSKIQAQALIQRLHELYTVFDDLCMILAVYKVETIGDAYFVSSNCPIKTPKHSEKLILLGQAMMEEAFSLDWGNNYIPKMRIGIHTGPVMAGVVGTKMPRYHLFGKTVLMAEGLESSGVPGCLHLSQISILHYLLQNYQKYLSFEEIKNSNNIEQTLLTKLHNKELNKLFIKRQEFELKKRPELIEELDERIQTYLIVLINEFEEGNNKENITNKNMESPDKIPNNIAMKSFVKHKKSFSNSHKL
mmetsp:Transcript_70225/g.86164  ORF Transcript_70225/g.86164 Transcript_70225/m.86164 type:complete len:563 (-) Transcript_70225:25-1713(-)